MKAAVDDGLDALALEVRRLREMRDCLSRWRRAKCPPPPAGACDGENHAEGCPVLVLWQDVIASHNVLDPNLERGR